MIRIKSLEEGKNNPYRISTISLWKENDNHYISFKCETKEKANFLLSYIDRLRSSIKAEEMKIGFSLVRKENHDNTVVIKGDVSEAVNTLIAQGILRNSNKTIFFDDDEEEIKNFLMESKKSSIIKKATRNTEVEKNNPKIKNCTIF